MIFVMPGSSQVGKLTISHLINLGLPSEIIISGMRKPEDFSNGNVIARKADYTDPESLVTAFEDVKTLILIPTTSPPAPRCVEYQNAISAAKTAGVERVIFLSILSANPGSVSAIAPFILFAENLTCNSGMEFAILRMGLYMEPVADWVPELIKLGFLPYPVKQGRVAYVTRDDVARCLAAVAQQKKLGGNIYNITAPQMVTMPELAQSISKSCGHEISFKHCSDEEFIKICFADNPSPFITRVLLSLYKAIELGEFDVSSSDVEMLTGKSAETVENYFQRVLSNE